MTRQKSREKAKMYFFLLFIRYFFVKINVYFSLAHQLLPPVLSSLASSPCSPPLTRSSLAAGPCSRDHLGRGRGSSGGTTSPLSSTRKVRRPALVWRFIHLVREAKCWNRGCGCRGCSGSFVSCCCCCCCCCCCFFLLLLYFYLRRSRQVIERWE